MRPYLILLLLAMVAACSKPVVREPVPERPVVAEPKVELPAEDNPYALHYVARRLHGVKLSPGAGEPKIYTGVTETDDYQRMLNDGYEMLGYSNFEATDVPPSRAVAQAAKVKADAVVLYTKLLAGPGAAMKIQRIKAQSSDSGAAAGTGEVYSYFATYWAKLAPPFLGVHVMQRREDDPEPGLTVLAVITGSPAAQAGLVVGDVLLSLAGERLSSAQELQAVSHQHAGQEVELLFRRVNAEKRVRLTLGAAL
ncbi:PDZ domain-containing protein [Methylobacillus arboreus]|uniref:PDZ domain-containing protein n=1 Tax=Methylobacillus arboreus TaxID=755170 RepID=UPI001E417272|nr:PDZ domain-containing protein [Methylobacillus arboreus]MCB5191362.1 PDZ domain-containing protein [Methylobacillus arboreus]